MISYLLVVEQHRSQIVILALFKCQQDKLSLPTRRSSDLRERIAGERHDLAAGQIGADVFAGAGLADGTGDAEDPPDRKSTRLNSSHTVISYAVFCLKKNRTQIVIHALLKCQQQNLYHEQN